MCHSAWWVNYCNILPYQYSIKPLDQNQMGHWAQWGRICRRGVKFEVGMDIVVPKMYQHWGEPRKDVYSWRPGVGWLYGGVRSWLPGSQRTCPFQAPVVGEHLWNKNYSLGYTYRYKWLKHIIYPRIYKKDTSIVSDVKFKEWNHHNWYNEWKPNNGDIGRISWWLRLETNLALLL